MLRGWKYISNVRHNGFQCFLKFLAQRNMFFRYYLTKLNNFFHMFSHMFIFSFWSTQKIMTFFWIAKTLSMVFTSAFIRRKMQKQADGRHDTNRNHVMELSTVDCLISEWRQKDTFDFNEIVNNYGLLHIVILWDLLPTFLRNYTGSFENIFTASYPAV